MSGLIWTFLLGSAAFVITVPRSSIAVKCLVIFSILRLIVSIGPEFTVTILGVSIVSQFSTNILIDALYMVPQYLQVIFKGIHLISIMGNSGTFNKPVKQIILDTELIYHVGYLILCILGVFMHPFFFSVLVTIAPKHHLYEKKPLITKKTTLVSFSAL